MPRSSTRVILWVAPFLLMPLACGGAPEDGDLAEFVEEAAFAAVSIPPKGTSTTLDIGEWNIEWFGSTQYGPTNETLQRENVRDVIKGADLDIWAVEEIVSASQWSQLLAELPGYAGLLANEPSVTSGSSYYTSAEQKVGILYKTSAITVKSAKIILTAEDYNFAGRPPLQVSLTASVGGATLDFVLVALHAKAMSDAESYDRRKGGSVALKSYLDSTYPSAAVIVAGDFNDDVDTSISGNLSPYKNFVDDAADYMFPTKALSDAGKSSTASGGAMIDHHLVTNEMKSLFVSGSAEIYRVDQYIASYSSTASDHYPTITRYALKAPPAAPAQVIVNEVLANEQGSDPGGEFVEIVNTGGSPADLSGYTIADATGVKHTFAGGTTLGPGAAVVVFGAASGIPSGVGGAVAASSGGLSLNNGGDTVTLKDAASAIVDSVTFTSALAGTDGVSMNRSPDGSPTGGFVLHTSLVAALSSPGKKASGSSF